MARKISLSRCWWNQHCGYIAEPPIESLMIWATGLDIRYIYQRDSQFRFEDGTNAFV
jgi:hypothetical protein